MSLRINVHSSGVVGEIGLGLFVSLALLLGTPEATRAQDTGEAVIEAMTAYLDRHPDDVARRRQLAERLIQKGRLNAAIEQLQTLLNQRPADTAALRRLAEMYDWTDRPQKTIPLYERLLRLHPNDVSVRIELARRHLWTNQVGNSIHHLEIVAEQQPNNLTVRRDLVQQYLWTNQSERARTLLAEVVSKRPNDLDARRQLADLYFWSGQARKGIAQLEWIVDKKPEATDTRKRLVQQYLWTDQPEKCIPHLEQIVQAAPNDLDARKQLAQLYLQTEQTTLGIMQLMWTVKQDSMDLSVRQQLAEQLFSVNEPSWGLDHLRFLVQRRPDDRALRSTLARRSLEHDHLNAAIDQYQWFVDHPPVDSSLKASLLQHLLWAERYEKVASLGTHMLAADPDNVSHRFHVARALAWSDRPKDALPHLDTLLTHAPDHVEALLLSAELRRWMPKEWPKARKHAERVLSIAPDNKEAKDFLRALRHDYGSTSRTVVRYETDSNGRSHLRTPLRTTVWLGGLWHAVMELNRHQFLDTSVSPLSGFEGAVGVQAQFPTGTAIKLLGTATAYENGWSPFGGTVSLQQSMGVATLTTRYRHGEMRESVTALSSRRGIHELEGNLTLHFGPRFTLSGEGTHTWISDTNRQVKLIGSSWILLHENDPALALQLSYQYEDTEQIFFDSRPYWTPNQLVTLSGALSLNIPIREWLEIETTLGLSGQNGEVGTDYGGRLNISPGFFHSIQATVERFGSGTYAYRAMSVQYIYRF